MADTVESQTMIGANPSNSPTLTNISQAAFDCLPVTQQTEILAQAKTREVLQRLQKEPDFLSSYIKKFKETYSREGKEESAGKSAEEQGQREMVRLFGRKPTEMQTLYKQHPEWTPKSELTAQDKARHDYFGPRQYWVDSDNLNQVKSSGVLLNILTSKNEVGRKTVEDSANAFGVDARGIATAVLAEGYANLHVFPKSWRPNLPGYGSLHPQPIRSMSESLGWNGEQQKLAKELPETAIPLVAQDMDIKAKIYQLVAGVNIRNNPEMLAWAYNTSMSNIVESAVDKAKKTANCELPVADLTLNKQLASIGMGALSHQFLKLPQIQTLKGGEPQLNLLEQLSIGRSDYHYNSVAEGKYPIQDLYAQEAAGVVKKDYQKQPPPKDERGFHLDGSPSNLAEATKPPIAEVNHATLWADSIKVGQASQSATQIRSA